MTHSFLSILYNCSLWSFAHTLSSSAPLSSLLEFHGHPGQRSHPQRSVLDPISSCSPSPSFAHTLTFRMGGASFTFQQRHHLYIPAPLEDQSHELEGKACTVYGKRPKKTNCRWMMQDSPLCAVTVFSYHWLVKELLWACGRRRLKLLQDFLSSMPSVPDLSDETEGKGVGL